MPNHREGTENKPRTHRSPPRRRGIITGATNAKRAPLDAGEALRVEEAEIQQIMNNWALWCAGGAAADGISMTNAYDLAGRGRRDAKATTLLNGEAVDVDAAVRALPDDLRAVIVERWLKKGSAEQHAARCGCSVSTYYRRLDAGHERIRALLRAKRDQAERARAQYRAHRRNYSEGNLAAPPPEARDDG